MGSWGDGPFENDTAADWTAEFEGADREAGLDLVRAALRAAAASAGDDYLDSDNGVEAVAAAEMVAAIRGLGVAASPYNETALGWVATTRPTIASDTVTLAIQLWRG